MITTYQFKMVLVVNTTDGNNNPSVDIEVKTMDFNQLKAVVKRSTAAITGWVAEQEKKV